MHKHLSLSHLSFLEHGVEGHPENRKRLEAILHAFSKSPNSSRLNLSCSRAATKEELCLVHDSVYVEWVSSLKGMESEIDGETPITPGSVDAALTAAGLGIELLEQIIEGNIQNGFALVRPPGHHATPQIGMGFCIFNNIAITAKKALEYGVRRILILDWDVHHGNGTQDAFYDDSRVFHMDFHQTNLFPLNTGFIEEIGRDKGRGFTLNVPLAPNSQDHDYLYLFDHLINPLARGFCPELVLVSAGFDAHESDPLGFMKLTTPGFGKLTAKIKALAQELCSGKLLFFLEGGYNPFWLARNVMECVNVLSSDGPEDRALEENPSEAVQLLIEEIHAIRSTL